jgi:hypothetical protein
MSANPSSPTPPLHDPISPPERDPPNKPLHDPAGDPTFEAVIRVIEATNGCPAPVAAAAAMT